MKGKISNTGFVDLLNDQIINTKAPSKRAIPEKLTVG
jgi:hypothetical protein